MSCVRKVASHGRDSHRPRPSLQLGNMFGICISILLVSLLVVLSGCSGADPSVATGSPNVSANWQFSLSATGTSFSASPLQGGFLLQQKGSITGQVTFSISLPTNGGTTLCNSGTATVTGSVAGQTVSLKAAIPSFDQTGNPSTQTLTLTGGTLSSDGSTIQNGTYTLSPGYYVVTAGTTAACGGGSKDTGSWTATAVPPMTGSFQGFFHSTNTDQGSSIGGSGIENQNFAVSGTFTQGPNIGAASATVTGTLLFQDPVTLQNNYPCLTTASVTGTISGNVVVLQIYATNGTDVGQIGQTPANAGINQVTYDHTQSGYVLHNVVNGPSGVGYALTTKSCPSGGGIFGDSGNLCLAFGGSSTCTQPVSMTPFALTFSPQLLGSSPTSQTVTLTNNTNEPLSGGSLMLQEFDSDLFYPAPIGVGKSGGGDFNGVHNFTEQDNCSSQGIISLAASASCTITVSFSPQESCPWLPQPQTSGVGLITGLAPAKCPVALTASLQVSFIKGSPTSAEDGDNTFTLPITGYGLSAVVPSVPEVDFGAQAVGEVSPQQTVTFTNQSSKPVMILPYAGPCTPYTLSFNAPAVPRPPVPLQARDSGLEIAATQLAFRSIAIAPNDIVFPAPTAAYFCDIDAPVASGGSGNPNILITSDVCSGQTLQPFGHPGNTCSIQIAFAPQPATWALATVQAEGMDDFLQLNSAWCGDSNNAAQNDCEIDSGRFPVEIKTNPPSSLRMTPAAGMDFGFVIKGTASTPFVITLFNDPTDPNAAPVTFTSKLVTGDYLETDTCSGVLAVNSSCAFTVTFTPNKVGLDPGVITLTYSATTSSGIPIIGTQTIYLRGSGQ